MANLANPESRAEVMAELRAEATRIFTQPEPPTVKQMIGYFNIAKRIPSPDFHSSFEAEKEANTPRYQRVVREARILVLLTRQELEEARTSQETQSPRGSQRTIGRVLRKFAGALFRSP